MEHDRHGAIQQIHSTRINNEQTLWPCRLANRPFDQLNLQKLSRFFNDRSTPRRKIKTNPQLKRVRNEQFKANQKDEPSNAIGQSNNDRFNRRAHLHRFNGSHWQRCLCYSRPTRRHYRRARRETWGRCLPAGDLSSHPCVSGSFLDGMRTETDGPALFHDLGSLLPGFVSSGSHLLVPDGQSVSHRPTYTSATFHRRLPHIETAHEERLPMAQFLPAIFEESADRRHHLTGRSAGTVGVGRLPAQVCGQPATPETRDDVRLL